MTVQGTVRDGTVILDGDVPIPDGTRVQVIVSDETGPTESKPTLAFLMKYAGCMKDLPADFAQQHDHYIHGTPKR
jgi:hypothetical protein